MAKQRILIVDDLAIYREPISMALEIEGYKTAVAENGKEALKVVESSLQPFDLMIVDYSMPEMDGIGFLQRARNYEHMRKVPSIMLTDMADKAVVVQALKLGASDYILKSAFSLPTLLEKVKLAIASSSAASGKAAAHRPPETSHQPVSAKAGDDSAADGESVLFKVKKFIEKNPIPQALQKILSVAESEDSDGLSSAISTEPLLAALVLKVANSLPYIRSSRKVSSLQEAVVLIGFGTIRNIAAKTYFCEMYAGGSGLAHWRLTQLRHSFCVARLMDQFCEGGELSKSAHIVGLCHDLPEIILSLVFPQQFEEAMKTKPRDFNDEISKRLETPFFAIANLIFSEFGLPAAVSEPIAHFHGIRSANLELSKKLSIALSVAHSYAAAYGLSSSTNRNITFFADAFLRASFDEQEFRLVLPVALHREVDEALRNLGIEMPPRESETDTSSVKVLYVPDPALPPNDPLRRWLQNHTTLSFDKGADASSGLREADCIVAASLKDPSDGDKRAFDALVNKAKELRIPLFFCSPGGGMSAGYQGVQQLKIPLSVDELNAALRSCESDTAGAEEIGE